jgi:hypothetical protein
MVCSGFNWLRIGSSGGFYEHGNIPSGSIKGGEFLYSNFCINRMDSSLQTVQSRMGGGDPTSCVTSQVPG